MTGSLEFGWFAGGKAHLVIDSGHGRGLESFPVTSKKSRAVMWTNAKADGTWKVAFCSETALLKSQPKLWLLLCSLFFTRRDELRSG